VGDPKNPIGKYWLALEGADDRTRGLSGYGIHGTIEPDSIGKQASMGCVRLRDDDIALVYQLLVEGESLVTVTP
jgi:lipoprotein-anchoring transpeptidase ErfK/SrfK